MFKDDLLILENLEEIRKIAGDLNIGYFDNGKKMRGNIGGCVTRACDTIENLIMNNADRLNTQRPNSNEVVGKYFTEIENGKLECIKKAAQKWFELQEYEDNINEN